MVIVWQHVFHLLTAVPSQPCAHPSAYCTIQRKTGKYHHVNSGICLSLLTQLHNVNEFFCRECFLLTLITLSRYLVLILPCSYMRNHYNNIDKLHRPPAVEFQVVHSSCCHVGLRNHYCSWTSGMKV